MSATHGGLTALLARQLLNRPYILLGLLELRGQRIAENIACGAFGLAGLCRRTVDGLPDDGFTKVISYSNKAVSRSLPETSAGTALISSRVMTAGRRFGLGGADDIAQTVDFGAENRTVDKFSYSADSLPVGHSAFIMISHRHADARINLIIYVDIPLSREIWEQYGRQLWMRLEADTLFPFRDEQDIAHFEKPDGGHKGLRRFETFKDGLRAAVALVLETPLECPPIIGPCIMRV